MKMVKVRLDVETTRLVRKAAKLSRRSVANEANTALITHYRTQPKRP